MYLGKPYFVYNGKSSADMGVSISGSGTWDKPSADFNKIQVPGRNGDLYMSNKRYSNVKIVYSCLINRNYEANFNAFVSHLLKDPGYHRLEDSYHPDFYRVGVVESDFTPEMGAHNKAGIFEVEFSCKPQIYLKSGERQHEFTADGTIYNPTQQEAMPLIRVYGTGILTVNGYHVPITENDSYIDLDCDIQDAYRGTTNCNGCIEYADFPVLRSGNNAIVLGSGITKAIITPRWWTL